MRQVGRPGARCSRATVTAKAWSVIRAASTAFARSGSGEVSYRAMARYLQMEVAEPPQLSLEEIRASWSLKTPVADRPSSPQTDRDWRNYIGVILRDAERSPSSTATPMSASRCSTPAMRCDILRASATGRYFYAIGRDGKVTLITSQARRRARSPR